ncbi:J domain-containing protein [Paenibacillus sp. GCM10012307]|uniref:J domain-containing protein n=1 Tax=Paenibacillus roseus TaxID=2798579 RepID=A0A934J549_9BACL|nr:J domain-containing protein [Paenibacillus roseus]MBJ6360981.1 J domain-containing protein [Paenibacillus roseus]
MENLKQAYETLGLPEGASKEDVEKRYMTLVRRARAREKRSEDEGSVEDFDFEEINRAYKFILNADNQQALEEMTAKQYGKYKKMAGAAEKTDHFFHYYKYHLLGAVLLLALIGYGIKSYMDNQAEKAELAKLPPIDVQVMYHGQFLIADQSNDMKITEEQMLGFFPEWKRIKADLTYVPKDARNEIDMANIQKAVLMIITEHSDVYVFDKTTFAQLAAQGLLIPLDDKVNGSWKDLLLPDQLMSSRTSDDTGDHVYGIDVSHSKLLELPPKSDEYVVGIRADSERREHAYEFIEYLLQKE